MEDEMDEAYALSCIFGPFLVIQGLWMMVQRKNCMKICESIRKTPAAIYVVGWTSLLVGLVMVEQFNLWQANLLIFVTLLGWAYLLRGLVVFFAPQLFLKCEMHEKKLFTTWAVVRLVWGLILVWIAFMLA